MVDFFLLATHYHALQSNEILVYFIRFWLLITKYVGWMHVYLSLTEMRRFTLINKENIQVAIALLDHLIFWNVLIKLTWNCIWKILECTSLYNSTVVDNLVNYWLVSGDFYEKAEILRNLEIPLLLIYKLFFRVHYSCNYIICFISSLINMHIFT